MEFDNVTFMEEVESKEVKQKIKKFKKIRLAIVLTHIAVLVVLTIIYLTTQQGGVCIWVIV